MTGTTRENIFRLKRSNISGKIPTSSQLLVGEMAVNTQDGFLYTAIADSGGTTTIDVKQIGWDRLSTISGGTVNGDTVFTSNVTASTLTARLVKRISTVSSSATPALNTDVTDIARLTGLTSNITNASTNLTGTPLHGDLFSYEITDNGVARTISWGASFSNTGTLSLPTTTVISTLLRCLFQYNSITGKWEIIAVV